MKTCVQSEEKTFLWVWPRRAMPWLLVILLSNLAVYFLSKQFNLGLPFHNVATSLDQQIPFVAGWIWIYVLAYVQWAVGFTVLAWEEPSRIRRIAMAFAISEGLCLLCFLLYPTMMIGRPEVEAEGSLTRWLCAWIFAADTPPTNLFPSIHCMQSWYVARMAFGTQTPAAYRWGMMGFSLLVFASTVLVKQHVLIDIPGGILVAEAGLFLSRLITGRRAFDRRAFDRRAEKG